MVVEEGLEVKVFDIDVIHVVMMVQEVMRNGGKEKDEGRKIVESGVGCWWHDC